MSNSCISYQEMSDVHTRLENVQDRNITTRMTARHQPLFTKCKIHTREFRQVCYHSNIDSMWETFAQKTPSSTFQPKENVEEKREGYGWQMFQRISFYLFRNNKFEEKGVGGLKLFKDNGEQVKTCKKVGTRLCSFMKGLYPHKPFWRHFNLEVPFFSEKAQWVFRNT